jgi:D-glycero-beta-D-manno-heptose-7-phosphate kinase
VLGSLTSTAKRYGIPLVVDSRFRMSEFSGVTSITPNITELEASVGRNIGSDAGLLKKVGAEVMHRQKLSSLLVTQGRWGMTLFVRDKPPLHIPIYGSDEVTDVTGAGDTVIAVFTLTLTCGGEPEDAARLANYAGGIVVMKRGTATITANELRAAIHADLSE